MLDVDSAYSVALYLSSGILFQSDFSYSISGIAVQTRGIVFWNLRVVDCSIYKCGFCSVPGVGNLVASTWICVDGMTTTRAALMLRV
jgi:hypothetical protein